MTGLSDEDLQRMERELRERLPELEERLKRLEEAQRVPQWIMDLEVTL
jgi:sugar-specific transcriptional regulator TrmB